MILISHRGNINGTSMYENRPEYIQDALAQDFNVEIDVWWIDNEYWLGHDRPQYLVDESYLENPNFWCHAKNIDALSIMVKNKNIHCFWHQEDDVTLTSKGYMWTYPNKQLTSNSIAVLPKGTFERKVAGVCSDYIENYKDLI
jgi:hypothetical protein